MPAEEWAFIEPLSCDTAIIRDVGIDQDICDIGAEVLVAPGRVIELRHVGWIATRRENLTMKGQNENNNR